MATLNFEEDDEHLESNTEPQVDAACCPVVGRMTDSTLISMSSIGFGSKDSSGAVSVLSAGSSASRNGQQLSATAAAPPSTPASTEKILHDLVKQTQENSNLLRQALVELRELKEQVQSQRRYPFTVKTCGFERELVVKAKELFITHGPWLIQGALEKIKEKIESLLGGSEKADAHHVTSCVSYCKERYTLWRADIRKKVLNKKLNHLKIDEFTQKLYTPFKSKDEDMRNASKTALLLRKFASENGYFDDSTKSDFWEKFVDFVNLWNNVTVPNKWTALRVEDESKYKQSLSTTH